MILYYRIQKRQKTGFIFKTSKWNVGTISFEINSGTTGSIPYIHFKNTTKKLCLITGRAR